MPFAERLKELREQAGMTQAELAERASIPLGTLRDYEQGKRRNDPSLRVAAKLAAALGVSVEVFARSVLDEADPPEEPPARGRGKAASDQAGKDKPASKGRGKKGD